MTCASPRSSSTPTCGSTFTPTDLEPNARRSLSQLVEARDIDGMNVQVRHTVLGDPAAQPLEAAKRGDLLVVGSRGLGEFHGLLLGVVGNRVAHRAPGPVVIVPQ